MSCSGPTSYKQEPEAGPNRFGMRVAQLSLNVPEWGGEM